ncbi:hypothetical protein RF55_5358 [Lasius niger]|uniref:Uncharacterized protein n=1 Tax=Lasius niger TaxID=67767 RepID=A0A0J7KW53_LASNI|nr:hypothetical protein RF55_12847 [Lasius niger]KMQ94484.1 hypothetical protein RF55_5358 [Lasius niger]
MENGPKDRIQYGGSAVTSKSLREVISSSQSELRRKMDYREQIRKLREEENSLLQRIEKRIRMQGIIKKQQARINMLRRLAGEEEEETIPTPVEIEEISRRENNRAAEVSRKVFFAIQAVNTEGTFCKKATIKDSDNKSECDVNVIVSIKRAKTDNSTVRPIKIDLTIKDNAMRGDIIFLDNKEETVPCDLKEVIAKLNKSSSSKDKENQPTSAKPKILSDVRICIPRVKVDNKANYSQRRNTSVKQRKPLNRGKSATKTKQEEKDMDAEIAQLKEMLSRAQRKRSSTSYRENSGGDSDPNDNDDSMKGLPRNWKSRRSPLAGVLKPVVSANYDSMIPADINTVEAEMELPESSQSQTEPEKQTEVLDDKSGEPDPMEEKNVDEEPTPKESDQEVEAKVVEGEQRATTPSFKYSV